MFIKRHIYLWNASMNCKYSKETFTGCLVLISYDCETCFSFKTFCGQVLLVISIDDRKYPDVKAHQTNKKCFNNPISR